MKLDELFALSLVSIAFGCGVEPEPGDFGPGELVADETQEIVENLRQAGNPAAEIEVRGDGTVLLGGDAVVTLEASREMVGREGEDEGEDDLELRQYRSTNFVAPSVDTICVNGAAFTGDLSTALDTAIARYNDLSLSFDLVRTAGAGVGCDATITANVWDGLTGQAGFPSGGLPFGTINIGDDIIATFGVAAATHVITHELGHCIGFRHTDYFDRSISCGTGGNEGDAGLGAIHIPGTPTGAVYDGSVMNSCYNGGSTGQWTANDLTALGAMYSTLQVPMVPSPLVRVSDQCFGLNSIYWAAQPNATSYQLWRSTSSSFTSPVLVQNGPYADADINVPSGTWYLRAKACNANGCSGWTNQVSATRINACL